MRFAGNGDEHVWPPRFDYPHEIYASRVSDDCWSVSMVLGGITVSDDGVNVWDALGNALWAYWKWMSWVMSDYSQGAAERLWGTSDSHATTDSADTGMGEASS